METDTLIADPANHHAAPAPSAVGSASRDLRAELAKAIAVRRAADARAAEAKRIADRADETKVEAALSVEQLKAGIDAAGRESVKMHAERLTAAFRAGEPLPDAPAALPEANSAAFNAALARLNALHQAACSLATEYNEARSEASAAASACREIVDAILAADARAFAAEWIAAVRLGWELQDRLTGLARLHGGALLPHEQQAALLEQVDRRKAAICEDALMVERYAYNAHLDSLAADQETAWLDYARRLMNDPGAVFDGIPEQSQ